MTQIGVQTNGTSPSFTKDMAIRALEYAKVQEPLGRVADIGGGSGALAAMLAPRSQEVWLVDYSPPEPQTVPANVTLQQADFNQPWPLTNSQFDFSFSLECIEHVENPRHFMRELVRITKPGGHIFVSTPNNHTLASKLMFVLSGQHRCFQDSCYPAHVTALLKTDFERMASELGLRIVTWVYSNTDTVPKLQFRLNLPGISFSMTMGVLLQKPA
ncbi:MAG TPA: class I SAM-dependent methyltransferase [Candidatus Methylacidiphilales bacterium]|jgi:2-polyprenyl-3-methyl-5-hydroxy-6-metoxy-1,4-benzoquinol methylase|nr:class I SAM-dependent methyltransferase [Candidatus Methylacidiphilales bacterium]